MAWRELGAFAGNFVLNKLIGNETVTTNTTVLEIPKKNVNASRPVLIRGDGIVLFGPVATNTNKIIPYDIVLHLPHEQGNIVGYSLYRSQSREDAEDKFNALAGQVPDFLKIVPKMFNTAGLQSLCDVLIANPSWSLAHLMAHFNLTEHLSHPKVVEFINFPDHVSNMTPLQLAIKSGNVGMVRALLPQSNLDHLDANRNTLFHYAAEGSREVIEMLTARTANGVNQCNNDGLTPLHLACMKGNPDCVAALLLAGANVDAVAELSNTSRQLTHLGGSPLHFSSTREVLNALGASNCNLNLLNFKGQTALHVMVGQNRLDCVVSLLSHEAEIDIKDQDGNTPLHIAMEKKNVAIVQALVVFGCDINLPTRDGKTPRHMVGKDANGSNDDMILYILHSVGARRCPESNSNCPPGCNAKGTYNGIPPAKIESVEQKDLLQTMLDPCTKSKKELVFNALQTLKPTEKCAVLDTSKETEGNDYLDSLLSIFAEQARIKSDHPDGQSTPRGRLLCLDGGGIRGLVLVQMLMEIERLSQIPINHMFDWIAGTSTGGVLALGMCSGKSLKQCMCLYLRLKDVAFIGSRPYNDEPLERVLKETLGETTVMSDIVAPKVMITGVIASRKPVLLHLFRNYKSAKEMLGIVTPTSNCPPPEKQLLWRAARASGAAPSYFRTFEQFLDGGLIANNPTLDAMTEIHQYNLAMKSIGHEKDVAPLSCVVSLGTGLPPTTQLKEIDVFRPETIWDTAKLAYGVSALGTLLVDQATAADGHVVDRARAWCSMSGIPYYRFNPQMSVDVEMDERSDQVLINLLWETKAYMFANQSRVYQMIERLK